MFPTTVHTVPLEIFVPITKIGQKYQKILPIQLSQHVSQKEYDEIVDALNETNNRRAIIPAIVGGVAGVIVGIAIAISDGGGYFVSSIIGGALGVFFGMLYKKCRDASDLEEKVANINTTLVTGKNYQLSCVAGNFYVVIK